MAREAFNGGFRRSSVDEQARADVGLDDFEDVAEVIPLDFVTAEDGEDVLDARVVATPAAVFTAVA